MAHTGWLSLLSRDRKQTHTDRHVRETWTSAPRKQENIQRYLLEPVPLSLCLWCIQRSIYCTETYTRRSSVRLYVHRDAVDTDPLSASKKERLREKDAWVPGCCKTKKRNKKSGKRRRSPVAWWMQNGDFSRCPISRLQEKGEEKNEAKEQGSRKRKRGEGSVFF